jgi:hypothetical protein
MKLYEISNINQTYNPNRIMGLELEFVSSINSNSGESFPAEKQPDDYDHVKRLTHMLFLAWNDENPTEGVVYLGELVDPNDETRKFYKFFKQFNGFSINNSQKALYNSIKNGGYTATVRQTGATVLLLTIAAWECLAGKNVKYVAHNCNTKELYRRNFKKGWTNVSDSTMVNIDFVTPYINPREMVIGYSNMRVIFDNYAFFEKYNSNLEFWSKYEAAVKYIPDFKEYGIDTFE